MHKKIISIFLLVTMLLVALPGVSMADVIEKSAPEISATSYIVIDSSTGEVLFGNNYQQQCVPAEITQIMTAIIAIESDKLDNEITVPELPDYNGNGAVTVHLNKGERYTLRSLIEVMLVSSANDAAYVIADEVGGSVEKFVTRMNEKAKEIGMTNSVFKNPTGIDEEGQMVTAEDMAKLARYAMQNETFCEMVALQQVNWKGVSYEKPLPNTNQLLSIMSEATGVKSGSSNGAKYTLVGAAKWDNRELMGVILGAPDDGIYQSMKKILKFGYERTKVVPVIQKDTLEMTLEYGDGKQVRVVAGENYNVIQATENVAIVSYQRKLDRIELPIQKDSQIGVLEVLVDGTVVQEVPLVAKDSMRKPINWLFFATFILSVIYIASICSRIVNNISRSRRKREAASRNAAQETSKRRNVNDYEYLMNSVEHPKQTIKMTTKTTGKKTLTSSRNHSDKR